ncbi:MAG: hypothetical protein ACRDTN_05575, partial [Mycobacterium sp.]
PSGTYNWVLRTLSDIVEITDAKGQAVRLSRTHRFRHTRLTRLEVREIASDASFGVVGDRDPVRDLGFEAAAGPAWRYGRHAI